MFARLESMFDIDTVKAEIRQEALTLRNRGLKSDPTRWQHQRVRLRESSICRGLRAIKGSVHNKHDLLHLVYKIPVLGYLLNYVSYALRLPTQIRKIREEIVNCHFEISELEVRLSQGQMQDFAALHKRVRELESELKALKKRHEV